MKSNELTRAFAGKNVFLTGDTGFKGSWLAWWLVRMGARVHGLALPPQFARGPYRAARLDREIRHRDGDIRDANTVARALRAAWPDFVFHLAAQPIVRLSYEQPVETFDTNVIGTAHVLDALRSLRRPCAAVFITSDKCYENHEWTRSYREGDAMGGHDPYSASKGCAELVASAFRRSFFFGPSPVRVATARAGNVIGPGDWAPDRIVPDAIRAWSAGDVLRVRNPRAVRPWQHVLEPLAGYLHLGARLAKDAAFADAWNFGPSPRSARTVAELADGLAGAWGDARWKPFRAVRAPHEAHYLRLNIKKTADRLGWHPAWNFGQTVRHTAEGYRELMEAGRDVARVRAMMDRNIDDYLRSAANR